MATHSSFLAWEIPWIEDPVGYDSPWSHKRAVDDLAIKQLSLTRYENTRWKKFH